MNNSTSVRLIAIGLSVVSLYWFLTLTRLLLEGYGRYENLLHLPTWLCAYGWALVALKRKLPIPESWFWVLSYASLAWLQYYLGGVIAEQRLTNITPVPSFWELIISGKSAVDLAALFCVFALALCRLDSTTEKIRVRQSKVSN